MTTHPFSHAKQWIRQLLARLKPTPAAEIAIHPAPLAMHAYLDKLKKLCDYHERVEIALIAAADMPTRVGVTDNPDGFLRVSPGKVPLIILRDNIPETRWQSVVAHEFLHVLRWSIDGWVLRRLPARKHEEYMRLVENTMEPFTLLLMVGGELNVVWTNEEPEP